MTITLPEDLKSVVSINFTSKTGVDINFPKNIVILTTKDSNNFLSIADIPEGLSENEKNDGTMISKKLKKIAFLAKKGIIFPANNDCFVWRDEHNSPHSRRIEETAIDSSAKLQKENGKTIAAIKRKIKNYTHDAILKIDIRINTNEDTYHDTPRVPLTYSMYIKD